MSEYDHEPIRGLPEALPEDEHIIWQGAPDWKQMAASALHIRLSLFYFAIIAGVALTRGDPTTAAAMVAFALLVTAFFALFSYGVGRTTVYTLTNKRIVLRIGVALNKCINIPLSEIETANLKMLSGDTGSIVMTLKGMPRMGYIMLWPHARSLRFVRPQPMLRAIPDARKVAKSMFDATSAMQPIAQIDDAVSVPSTEGLPA
ncbi:photosynthetic complex putative assembly protein PuhB [Pontixanthobacter aestiaquae]|uniref:PH domain-containing protein n=1 Tax=Pontixanthobacter aestiaquae TaxID=1509367 RepID=A0A844Z8F6_9SPHN|nr:photosynthetic complex putative assembly protein PuhB [Pontixanthobacter aestiaquae]MDN3644788.1 photosynthetic complex putative assembly protein PuhB [Pontixanthobacter aestiaquae]MXO84205.1 PH domain-containing protein [Pontixanthobacter aestiaquae]